MNKREIRRKLLEARREQSEAQRKIKSSEIEEKLFSLPEFEKAETVLFYVSKKEEAHTEHIIHIALRSGKRAVVPIADKKKNLKLSEIRSLEELAPGAFGILEPKKEFVRTVKPSEIDLAIVPGVAFDEKGHRIGYGMGYYDKLLKKMRAPLIALAFDFQVIPEIPFEAYDVKVDKIITEKRVINCLA